MAILVRGSRPKLGPSRPRGRGQTGPSVREVCLLGLGLGRGTEAGRAGEPPRGGAWSEGDRVTWSGRAYRVEATQALPGDASGYVHLAPGGVDLRTRPAPPHGRD